MRWKQWWRDNSIVLVNLAYVVALVVVVAPLLILGKYNYPSADDWSFGAVPYKIIQQDGSFFELIRGVLEVVKENYINWEGRFTATLFAAFQPGIWGEQYYCITVWLMLGSIIVSEIFLARELLCDGEKKNGRLVLPIVVPVLLLQILCVKYPEESFYWYTGSMNYTFMYGLSLVLLALFLKMSQSKCGGLKYILPAVGSSILAVCVGGNNFATSLSTLLLLLLISCYFFLFSRERLKKTWYVTLILLVSFLIAVLAPANTMRLEGNFGGETGGAVEAVFMSLVRTFQNVYSWTDGKVLLLLIIVAPFLWKAVSRLEYKFSWPGIFTLLSFGVYASQITATVYVDGTTGGCRMGAILYYAYFVWLLINVGYWFGWLSQKERLSGIHKILGYCNRYCVLYCLVTGLALVCFIGATELKNTTFYKAYRSLKQGWAQEYARVWEERLVLLHDDSVRVVQVDLLDVYPEMIVYTDIQEEFLWVNEACAKYYGKDCVEVRKNSEDGEE